MYVQFLFCPCITVRWSLLIVFFRNVVSNFCVFVLWGCLYSLCPWLRHSWLTKCLVFQQAEIKLRERYWAADWKSTERWKEQETKMRGNEGKLQKVHSWQSRYWQLFFFNDILVLQCLIYKCKYWCFMSQLYHFHMLKSVMDKTWVLLRSVCNPRLVLCSITYCIYIGLCFQQIFILKCSETP